MRRTSLTMGSSAVALSIILAACGSKSTLSVPETARGAGVALQAAGIYSSQPLHVASASTLSAEQSLDSTYIGVESNVYSAQGDQPSIWEFKSVPAAKSAFKGLHPSLAASSGDFTVRCGALVILGDNTTKVSAARTALAKHFADCGAVTPLK